MTELSYTLAVFASIAYGAADFLGGLATKRSSMVAVVIVSQLAGLILVLFALPLLPAWTPSRIDVAWGAASGLAGGLGVALLYRGLAIGVMSVVAPVTAVCAVIIPLVVGMALGERPTATAAVGVALAIAAIVLVSMSDGLEERRATSSGLLLAIAAGVAIGIFFVFLARTGAAAGLWPLVAARIVSISLFSVVALVAGQRLTPRRESLPIVIGGGVLDMTSNILYLIAVRLGPLSIVATLTSLYPASTVILARVILGERLRVLQHLGVVCAAVAIVLIVAG